jgi:preprotein translocase subunit SecG
MPSDPLFIIVVLAVLLVVVVLMFGLGGFAAGGAFGKRNSNKIMRLRLLTQFIAVLLIVAYVYLRKDSG